MTRIALDLCGGDLGFAPSLAGARMALKHDPNLALDLYGTAEAIGVAEQRSSFTDEQRQRVQLHTCECMVDMTDKPMQVLRNKAESSMAKAIDSLQNGQCQGMVSSGNTSALVTLGLQKLNTLAGVERPAICTSLPARQGRTWLLDMGANLEPTLEQMLVNARMGVAQCRLVEDIQHPRVGVMNVGTEGGKGTRLEWKLAELLQNEAGIEFSGFAEGADLFSGNFDLIVCDGFTGNVALKTAEGMSRYLKNELTEVLHRHWSARFFLALTRRTLRRFREHMDPANYNGAALLGLGGLVVKSHGSSNANGVRHAIDYAAKLARLGCVDYLDSSLERPSHESVATS